MPQMVRREANTQPVTTITRLRNIGWVISTAKTGNSCRKLAATSLGANLLQEGV
jgi:hypothetical protein